MTKEESIFWEEIPLRLVVVSSLLHNKYPPFTKTHIKNSLSLSLSLSITFCIPAVFPCCFYFLSLKIKTMALKAVHVSDVPNLDQVPENPSFSLYSTRLSKGNHIIPIYLNTLWRRQ